MIPADIRDYTWEKIQPFLLGSRLEVLNAWRLAGPGTTQRTANLSGISILTLRPRTTELVQLGQVRLIGRGAGEGIYEAVPPEESRAAYEAARAAAGPVAHQTFLPL